MRRGQKTSAEQVVLKLRQIEVQTAQGKSLPLAFKKAEIVRRQHLWDRMMVFRNGGWLVHRSP